MVRASAAGVCLIVQCGRAPRTLAKTDRYMAVSSHPCVSMRRGRTGQQYFERSEMPDDGQSPSWWHPQGFCVCDVVHHGGVLS